MFLGNDLKKKQKRFISVDLKLFIFKKLPMCMKSLLYDSNAC